MTETTVGEHDGERLQKVLARIGLGSRRVCENLIADARVTVNGDVAVLGRRVLVGVDEMAVDGVVLSTLPDAVTYLLNKPAGTVTTASDPQGRPTVVELVPAEPRVFPVGRLDLDTEGLLLLTNDGTSAHRLTHPSFGVEKEYLAHVSGAPSRAALRRLREGIELDDGPTAPAKVSAVSTGLIRIVIHEGRNRQVRRMCRRGRAPGPASGPNQDRATHRSPDWRPVRSARSAGGAARTAAGRRQRRQLAFGPMNPAAGDPDRRILRALRGAITVDADRADEITGQTTRLLETLYERNGLVHDDVVSIMFTATQDLHSIAPAVAARGFGLTDVPLICTQEMHVEGSVGRCVRILAHVRTDRQRHELRHVFLRGAVVLRPDLAEPGDDQ